MDTNCYIHPESVTKDWWYFAIFEDVIYKLASIDGIFSQIGIYFLEQIAHHRLQATELVDDKYSYYLVSQLNENLWIFLDFVNMAGKKKILESANWGHRLV